MIKATKEYLVQELSHRRYGDKAEANDELQEEFSTPVYACQTMQELSDYADAQDFPLETVADEIDEWTLERFEEANEMDEDEDEELEE